MYSAPDASLSLVQPLESVIAKWWGRRSLGFEWDILRPYSLEGAENPALGTVPASQDMERAEAVCGVLY